MRILFLGAGKRLSLLEAFLRAGASESEPLSLLSIEDKERVPISRIAKVFTGPRFLNPEFAPFLLELTKENGVDVVIPNMDAATVALAKLRDQLALQDCRAIVSNSDLCAAMYDKVAASEWFCANNVQQPSGNEFPKIAKNRLGYGSQDQYIARTNDELTGFLRSRHPDDYLIQPFVAGQEYTVDAYVSADGRMVSALSRKRLEVSAGEVEISETHGNTAILNATHRVLALPGWRGPITLQFIDTDQGPSMIEINPRFGGGVTHAIHCGLDMPAWIIREHLGRSLPEAVVWKDGSFMTRCRRDIFHGD